jgi:hypothetical protein
MFCTARKVLGPAGQPKSATEIEFKGANWRRRFREGGEDFFLSGGGIFLSLFF